MASLSASKEASFFRLPGGIGTIEEVVEMMT